MDSKIETQRCVFIFYESVLKPDHELRRMVMMKNVS